MERALLVTINFKDKKASWHAGEKAAELVLLARSSGVQLAKEMIVSRDKPDSKYFIGSGKVEEIAELCADEKINVVIFDNDLTGVQQKNLEDAIGVKTIDRTQLILDIFARRAKSNEGKIQVELAQLTYLLPRLIGEGILLSRLGGGIGTRGPGEQKLEVDRRNIRDRIIKLKDELKKLSVQRVTRRKQRAKFSLLNIAIIGYTNSGKSTLLNSLTESHVHAEDRLFSTLDPTIRSFVLPNNQKILFADTVGFLHDLPHHLVESFKGTLEEAVNADLLLHLIDISHPKAKDMENAVFDVLEELGIKDKPIMTVLNKIDKVNKDELEGLSKQFNEPILISALKKENFQALFDRIILYLSKAVTRAAFELSHNQATLLNLIHERGNVVKTEYKDDKILIEADLPTALYEKIKKDLKSY